jgi:hypothetical protein
VRDPGGFEAEATLEHGSQPSAGLSSNMP